MTDNDRWPWLAAVREAALQEARRLEEAGEENGTESGRISDNAVVFACSALKRVYREVLAGYRDQTGHPITPALSPYPITFIYLKITPDLVRKRIMARVGHFMNPKLVDSQFEALEEPDLEEGEVEGVKRYSVVHVAVNESKDEKAVAKEALESWLSSS